MPARLIGSGGATGHARPGGTAMFAAAAALAASLGLGGSAVSGAAAPPPAAPAAPAAPPAPAAGSESAAPFWSLIREGRYAEAARDAREALARVDPDGTNRTLETAELLDVLVAALVRDGRILTPGLRGLAERSLAIREAVLGSGHPGVAASLRTLAEVLEEAGDHPAARPLFARALALLERAHGPAHADVARAAADVGRSLYFAGDMAGAQKDFERAVGLQEKLLGPRDPDLARTLMHLGTVLMRRGEYARAREVLDRSLAIREEALGAAHPETAEALNALGNHARLAGDYEGARRLYERALSIRVHASGQSHPRVATILTNLAILRYLTGDYRGSLDDHRRVLAIREAALGPDHPEVGSALNNLGLALSEIGEKTEARPILERAIAVKARALGPEHLELATTRAILADLHADLNDVAEARAILKRAIAIMERGLGPEAPRLLAPLERLAELTAEAGDRREARRLLERAREICDTRLPAGHEETASVLQRLAALFALEGDRQAAAAHHRQALEIREKTLGPRHPLTGQSLQALADLSLAAGDPAAARPLLARAVAIEEAVSGNAGPELARVLARLAETDARLGARNPALDTGLRAEEIARRYFRGTARVLSEREALRFESARTSGLDAALSALVSTASGPFAAAEVGRVWDQVIQSRALVLDEMAARRRTLPDPVARETREILSALERARFRLARLVVRGPEADGFERHAEQVRGAEAARDRAERALAAISDTFRDEQERMKVGSAALRKALPSSSALVAYVAYGRIAAGRDPSAVPGGSSSVPHYAAFVLPAGDRPAVVVPLGPGRAIDDLIDRWRRLAGEAPAPLSATARTAERRYFETAQPLRRAVWDPIVPHVGAARRVFIVPDGALHLLNFGTLPAGDGRYLAEAELLLHHLSAERDLVRPEGAGRTGSGLLTLGDPDYDAAPAAPAVRSGVAGAAGTVAADPSARSRPGAEGSGRRASCGDFRTLRFQDLPQSGEEVDAIAALWSRSSGTASGGDAAVLKLTGAAADEARFKRSAPGRRVIHLATHAFWLQDRCPSMAEAVRGGGAAVPSDNPLLLSGLALAGANRRQEIDPAAETEDGILTAEEVASLDLSGVEWAVLSACETGVGTVRSGEGVLGLRRAFESAGARTLIMTLWSVDDAAAREWMRLLFEGRAGGLPTDEAVHRAGRTMIRARREAGRSTHPFYWGAFVAAGDWR